MKTPLHPGSRSCLFTIALLFTASGLFAQSFYVVSKRQHFFQNSSAAPIAHPAGEFVFSGEAPNNVTFTAPAGAAIPLTFVSGEGYRTEGAFSTKAALDAAYPNGTYRMSGPGIPTLSFNLGADTYPSATPLISNGTWNAGGALVLDPAQTATLNVSAFTTYASAGAAGHFGFRIDGLLERFEFSREVATQGVFGMTQAATAPTSVTIPANTLTAGRVYEAEVEFDTLTTLDTTSVPGSGVIAIFNKTVRFYVAALAAGTTAPAIVITGQPASQAVPLGDSATFALSLTVGGATQFNNVQISWWFNGRQLNVDGTKYAWSNGGLRVNNVTAADAGTYVAVLIGTAGVVTSSPATLSISGSTAPTITSQPIARTISPGGTVVFNIGVGGGAANVQWRRDGADIPGATGPTLVLSGLTGANASIAGNYSAVVSNTVGSVTSSAATLAVLAGSDPGRLINLSILTNIPAPGASFTLGYVVGGEGTSGAKPLVIRAAGPSLGALGVPGVVDDPKMELFAGATKTGENDNWGGGADLVAALRAVGAFAYSGPTSRDAAAAVNITTRDNSVKVSANGSSTGTVIAEIYDATPSPAFNPSIPRLINVSVNKQIDAGAALTAGFVIGGSTAKTVLIRAIGPSLATFGVPGVMSDPQLTLFNSSQQTIASNNDWGGAAVLIDAAARVGAFALPLVSSRDAVLLVTLNPGSYTAETRGVGNSAGIAIVEVYDVP